MIKDILKRLIYVRQQAGLSQSQAAKLVGVQSASTISHWETGERELTVETLLKLCEIYDANLVWVMTGINPDFDPLPIMQAAENARAAREDLDKILDLLQATENPYRNG